MNSEVKDELTKLLYEYFNINDSYYYVLTRVKKAFDVGTMTLDDFYEFDEEIVDELVAYIVEKINNKELNLQPIVHARWTADAVEAPDGGMYNLAVCSHCKAQYANNNGTVKDKWLGMDYCPKCGAKME